MLKVLSYHLLLEADHNRIFSGKVSQDDISAIKAAGAVILPQGCKEPLYRLARKHCDHIFPNYDAFFAYPGKTGQAALFKKMRVPHPQTLIFRDLANFELSGRNLPSLPFVFKSAWGGEGKTVFFVQSRKEFEICLQRAHEWQNQGKKGFVLQEYIPCGGRSLRVVVAAGRYVSYWRSHSDQNNFYSNIAHGAEVVRDVDPLLQNDAVRQLKKFCAQTKINLAGFDFLFDTRSEEMISFFLEINYFFRCHGLGGVDAFHELLAEAVREWLAGLENG